MLIRFSLYIVCNIERFNKKVLFERGIFHQKENIFVRKSSKRILFTKHQYICKEICLISRLFQTKMMVMRSSILIIRSVGGSQGRCARHKHQTLGCGTTCNMKIFIKLQASGLSHFHSQVEMSGLINHQLRDVRTLQTG